MQDVITHPRVQQYKVGKFLKEDISLNDDDPRDVNDPNMNMMTDLLPLDSYNIDNNEKDFIQPHNHYFNEDKDYFFLETSLISYKAEYKTNDFFNKIPKKELDDLLLDNNVYVLKKNNG
jgi:hypothetical protein